MNNNLDFETLDNPYIQVIWEDSPENFSQEKIKSVKQYFQKKYSSTNVNVIVKHTNKESVIQPIDVSENIMDKNYQRELIRNLLQQKNIGNLYEKIIEIDSQVENRLYSKDFDITPFKKWYIKNIEFSNFLSYGQDQKLDFEKCNGITVVESDPPNFGGKTVLTVDLLLFLFFNTTTKTQKSEEIFNKFTDVNVVTVKGNVLIDGEEYIIARKLERKKSKSGEWNIKSDLDFFKKLPNGELQNYTGEQRRETEHFIKTSIGGIDDFLMTILTTASNLEDLLESKPTARGQVLSRFLGLEFLKKKEEICKEIYSDFSKTMLSNVYNTETLNQEIDESESRIIELTNEISSINLSILDVDKRLSKGQEYKENLMNSRFNDIDPELIIINPIKLQEEISDVESKINSLIKQLDNIEVIEPKDFYKEEEHDKIKEKLALLLVDIGILYSKISEIETLSKEYSNGVLCDHCGIRLIDAKIVKQKISDLDSLKLQSIDIKREIDSLDLKEKSFTELKKNFDLYEKNKLIKEKYEISIESFQLKKDQLEYKLSKYYEVQNKIKKNNEIEAQLIKANLRLDELISEKRNYEKSVSNFQNEIENNSKKIERNKGLIVKISDEYETEKIYKIYLEIFGKNGISKVLMKTMIPVINSELQRLLEDSCYFNLEVRINDKNEVEFIMIDNSTGVEKLITSGSGYEKTIAAMALRSVLSKVCSLPKPNIVVWDEVFGKISNDNLDLIGEFFNKIKDYFEKVFVISHNPMINNWATNIVKVKKTENISKVIQ